MSANPSSPPPAYAERDPTKNPETAKGLAELQALPQEMRVIVATGLKPFIDELELLKKAGNLGGIEAVGRGALAVLRAVLVKEGMSAHTADDMAIRISESLVARATEGEDLPPEEIAKLSSYIINDLKLTPIDIWRLNRKIANGVKAPDVDSDSDDEIRVQLVGVEDPYSGLEKVTLPLSGAFGEDKTFKKKTEFFDRMKASKYTLIGQPKSKASFYGDDIAEKCANKMFNTVGKQGFVLLRDAIVFVADNDPIAQITFTEVAFTTAQELQKDNHPIIAGFHRANGRAGVMYRTGKSDRGMGAVSNNIAAVDLYCYYADIIELVKDQDIRTMTLIYNVLGRNNLPVDMSEEKLVQQFLSIPYKWTDSQFKGQIAVAWTCSEIHRISPGFVLLMTADVRKFFADIGVHRAVGAFKEFCKFCPEFIAMIEPIGRHLYPQFSGQDSAGDTINLLGLETINITAKATVESCVTEITQVFGN